MSYGTEHGGVDVVHRIVHGVPCGCKACLGIVSYDVDAGDAGNLVDGQMVVGDHSTIGIGEPLAIAAGMSSSPHLIHDVLGKIFRISFAMEAGILATHHIKQYAKAGIVVCRVWHTSPILRTETPGDALGRLLIVGMGTIVFGIEEDDVNANLSGLCLQLASHLEEYPYPTSAIVGSKDWSAVIFRIRVGIGPGTAIPVST